MDEKLETLKAKKQAVRNNFVHKYKITLTFECEEFNLDGTNEFLPFGLPVNCEDSEEDY